MSDISLDSAPTLSISSLRSQDSLREPESLKLSLKCEGTPKQILLFKDLIITGVNGCHLLPLLYDIIEKEDRLKIKRIHDKVGPKKATMFLIKVLEEKDFPGKWERFVLALEKADYEFVAKALRGEEILKQVYDEQFKLLELFADDLIKTLKPSDIVPHLSQRKIINENDRQEIMAEEQNHGPIAGMIVLFDRLGHYKNPNWYNEFLDVLCETDYKQLVDIIDEDHIYKWERRKGEWGIKADMTSSKHLPDDDQSETEPKITVDSDIQREYNSGLTVQEDYMSETGGAQPSMNNLSAPPPPPDEIDQTVGALIKDLEISDQGDDEITQLKQVAQSEARSINMAGVGAIKEIAQKYLHMGRGKMIQGLTDDDKEISMSSLDKDKVLQSLDREVESTAHVPKIVGDAPLRTDSVYDNNVNNEDDDDEAPKVDPEPLELRKYQQELAEPALQGKNCIIVAPTGSGKTHVAMKIIQDHREKIRRIRIPKVIFLVEQSALAEQQAKQCIKYLGCKVKLITGETQRNENMKTLSHWLNTKDILVVTAQILVNALAEKEVQIQNFSLMVFDECHHAHAKHSYNKIMFHYMDLKLAPGNLIPVLPQIVGLTASVGVGKAKTLGTAVNWIKSMMANMDAEELSTVVKHRVELAEYVNIPQQVVKLSRRRTKDHFGEVVGKIMDSIVRYMKNSQYYEMLPASAYDVPVSKGSPQFTQWVSTLWREQAKIHDQTARKFFHTCRQYLDMYNRALIVYNDARASDSLTFIEGELKKWEETTIPDSTDEKMRTLFNKSRTILQHCSEDKDHDNPKLEELRNMILSAYRDKPDSRGIVFVKTRELTKAIEAWMQETNGLKELKPVQFVGAQASKDTGGMTKVAQDKALSLFRDGGHKIIIATSVAEEGLDIQKCNLVVRYDHVTNEIAMVQSRGRGRAEDSKYVVVAEDNSGTAEKEELNQLREVMMNDAIKQLREQFRKDKGKFLQDIEKKQKEAKAERDLAAANQHGRVVNQGEYVLRCVKCSNYICMASDVKKIQNAHHAVLSPDIRERVQARKIPIPTFQDENLTCGAGKLLCKECGSNLGNVSIYKQAQFPILKIEYLVIEDSVGNRDVKKKWKSVPFLVPELSSEDLQQQSKHEKLI